MNPNLYLYQSLIRHRWCHRAGVCTGCNQVLEGGGLQCPLCLLCRYCSHASLNDDRPEHRPVCDLLLHFEIKDMELMYIHLEIMKQILFRLGLLDSEGDIISPIGSNSARTHSTSSQSAGSNSAGTHGSNSQSAGSNSAGTHSTSSQSAGTHGSNSQSAGSNSAGTHSTSSQSAGTHSTSSQSAGSNSAGTHSTSSQSARSHSANSHSASSCIANSHIASRNSAHINSAGSNSMDKSHSTNKGPQAHSSSHSSSHTKQKSDPDTFGSGWWQAKKPDKTKTATSSSTKQTLLNPGNKGNKQRDNSAVNTSSSSSAFSSNTSSNSAVNTSSSSSAFSSNTSSNSAVNTSSSSSAFSSNTSSNSALNKTQNNTAKNMTREQSDSNSLGSGWWKHRFVNNSKRKTNSAESKADSIPSKVKLNHRIGESSEFVNRCTDVVQYKLDINLELIVKFVKVASQIDSSLIEEQAKHGRVLAMVLTMVPGLWRASLGGSCTSLVVEIVGRYPSIENCYPSIDGRYPSNMLGIVIRKNIKTARRILATEMWMLRRRIATEMWIL